MSRTSMIDRLNAVLGERYTIERELGSGGMATVYLARDLKHDRDVALKVLKRELAAVLGADRFLAEIRTTANLQHPNILPLFDSGEAGGFLYYVMPYVEGESLREKLDRDGQLHVEEAVGLACEVAEALHAAHDAGIVHRDVKPGNILMSRGRPLVADFGIALAVSQAGEGRLTETGLSLGTPYYMSPEQASGDRTPTAASDVYALGCVLYEMLVGEPPHTGANAQAVLGKILLGSPTRPTDLRATVPLHVEGAVLKALERLPADRFDSAADFARALRSPAFRYGRPAEETAGGATGWKAVAVVSLTLAVAFGALQVRGMLPGAGTSGAVERHRVVLGSGIERIAEVVSRRVALPPDGSGILFSDEVEEAGIGYRYWFKPTGEANPWPVPNMDDAVAPAFSPDGQWVAYFKDDQLRKQPLRGGTTVLLVDSVAAPGEPALAWLDDGTIVFEGNDRSVERVRDDGTGRETLFGASTVYPHHISGLLGGGGFLMSSCVDTGCDDNLLTLVDLERDTVQTLADDVLAAWHVLGDLVVYVDRQGAVFAAGLDRPSARLDPPAPLFDGVGTTVGSAQMEVGADGSVLYVRGPTVSSEFAVVWVDREGRAEVVHPAWGLDAFRSVELSPGDDRLAIAVGRLASSDVWVKELPEGPLTRLTVEPGLDSRPAWSRDGTSIAYISNDGGQLHGRLVRWDGTSPAPDTLVFLEGSDVWEVRSTSHPDLWLFRVGNTGPGLADLGHVSAASDEDPTLLLTSGFNEFAASPSPDGGWVAYVSDFSGQREVYVRPFPDAGARRVQISTNGGAEPVWSHSGDEIFYRDGEGWMTSATVAVDPEFRVEARERLFDATPYRARVAYRAYDVAEDGRRFLMLASAAAVDADEGPQSDLILIRNWFEELREIVERR